ncbi:orphan sodium- and chloride-dependent neurotransmitter transporter NTT5 isoform X1 [Alligator mississippiensis]|uniref:orphan sodium- and chloride-dependent neurotransmitter transporter NTT5 isoform X1 n=1 Tax=Alligator mississippiensis TaxID=8496 RepID=UPI002877795E|nr:orphan sodium- and chloride-dependent neurotransmitter transporter NTT5 isoform X1 [Alligator mississippiensis]XP_059584154.1 orphan sodium- and chloride-dependent neurotransmitter transporter NTT5 isoform X1 [Alligator mississippiensis]
MCSRGHEPCVSVLHVSAMEKSKPDLELGSPGESSLGLLPTEPPARPAWSSKAQYILAQVGFSVGLGNVWRFPYLCHQNGGGAFLLLYLLLLFVIGIPLFFLELAAGQSIRQGSIGVWKHISPRLAGIGFASCVVCSFVALYYNVIIAWSLFYLGHSFQYPLPWESCPDVPNSTQMEPECARSSPTTYFWYREALDVSDSISDGGGLDLTLTGCLLGAWSLVCVAMIRGIKSSGKVLYFSSLFPYVVLLCFLIRGLLLDGAADGIRVMFTPKLSIWGDVQVWRQAATQVFFALGLGFGSIIAYSSYNPRGNDCHCDALLVAAINFLTSVLATLVVFAVLGFRANILTQTCVVSVVTRVMCCMRRPHPAPFCAVTRTVCCTRRPAPPCAVNRVCNGWNTEQLSWLLGNKSIPGLELSLGNLSEFSPSTYSAWYQGIPAGLGMKLKEYGIIECRVEEEMNKGVEGTGLAFIAFTETMTLFPASPFWSVLFFFMLLNLGLSTMLGNMQGILTPLMDNFAPLRRRRTLFTVLSCTLGFLLGLVFVQHSGSYFVAMFDDYSATLPLVAVVACEAVAVAWVYGAERFLSDIEDMLGWRPWKLYSYMWRYGSVLAMLCLLLASLVNLCLGHPTYQAWDRAEAAKTKLPYPPWAMATLVSLIVVAVLPIPALYLCQLLREWLARRGGCPSLEGTLPVANKEEEEEEESPADPELPANGYLPVKTEDPPEGGEEARATLLGGSN